MNRYNRYTFKGKTKQGKWVYGNLLEPKRMHSFNEIDRSDKFCLIVESSFANGGWVSVGTKHWVLKETLCQCTGLKDKNGVEIYENDIVKINNNHYIVLYSENRQSFVYKQIKGSITYLSLDEIYEYAKEENDYVTLCIEVIGNKFDKEVE